MRPANDSDLPVIMECLEQMLEKSPAPQMKFAERDAAATSVEHAVDDGRAWIMGAYFIMVDIGRDWYSTREYLIEQIILKVYPDDTSVKLDTVIRNGLSYLADRFGCVAIAAGDTQIGYMADKYIAAGFRAIGTQFFKESRYGLHQKDHGGASPN